MRIWILLSLVLFVALVVSTLYAVRDGRLPTRHIDVEASWLRADAKGGTRLHLVLDDVPTTSMPAVAWSLDKHGQIVVVVRARAREATEPEHTGSVFVDLRLPETDAVLVLDKRWAHAKLLPEALRIERSVKATPDAP